jgi:hypothetical protein
LLGSGEVVAEPAGQVDSAEHAGPGALAPNPGSFVIGGFVIYLVAMMAACRSSEGFDRRGCAAAVAGTVLGSGLVVIASSDSAGCDDGWSLFGTMSSILASVASQHV